jgi:hypothetical protein
MLTNFHIEPISGHTQPDSPGETRSRFARGKEVAEKRFDWMINRWLGRACVVLFLVLISCARCYSADIVLVRSAEGSPSEQRELEIATGFYGVNLKIVTVANNHDEAALGPVRQKATVAVAIEANALAVVNREGLLRALHSGRQRGVPLLIFGVTPATGRTLLNTWSGGATVGAERLGSSHGLHYTVRGNAEITHQLANLDVPFPGSDTLYFALGTSGKAQEIVALRNDRQVAPLFIETDLGGQEVFLLCEMPPSSDSADWNADSTASQFMEIAPLMMFAKHSVGERGWHTDQHYANLTIDDPWLREPYGHLSYRGLLQEMERHNFHSTIAFIPWNYDRSQPETVSIFRQRADRFSISIHGDNHDHKEFTDYRSKALAVQIPALKQAVARMDRFQALTGISYDKVMVFPHSIAPEKTLEALKTYNFLATVNSSNVPMDRPNPSALPFALRSVTVEFGNFASIRRYPVEGHIPASFIAVSKFLDNPLFFYCHQDFFSGGIDAFDGVADQVNRLEPDTRWLSAGEIVRRLYLIKLRDDSDYDVFAFSGEVRIDNVSGRDSIFHLRKQEDGKAVLGSVSVDGHDYPYRLDNGYLDLAIPIPAGQARSVVIRYKNDLNLAAIDISKQSARVYLLRTASDFRDITLTKYSAGRALIAFYYEDPARRTRTVVCLAALITLLVFCVWVAMRLRKTIAASGRMRNAGTPT